MSRALREPGRATKGGLLRAEASRLGDMGSSTGVLARVARSWVSGPEEAMARVESKIRNIDLWYFVLTSITCSESRMLFYICLVMNQHGVL